MLADDVGGQVYSGELDRGIHLSGAWLDSLISFVETVLPLWRDDPKRPSKLNEDALTTQLCSRLTTISRHTPGWDFLQFRREEPDEADGRRSIDFAVSPSGKIILIEGRQYTEYETLLPVECKRLPTPLGKNRDEREYVYSDFSSTGGIQRFKAGNHASAHVRAAMIGYIQAHDIPTWTTRINGWIDDLSNTLVAGWSSADKLSQTAHNTTSKTASFSSVHVRSSGLSQIRINHLWIEM